MQIQSKRYTPCLETIFEEDWKIYYCPIDPNHRLTSKSKYNKHLQKCAQLQRELSDLHQCPYTNAHLLKSQSELSLHSLVCMFNPHPNYAHYY